MTRLLFSPYHTFPRRAKKKRKKKTYPEYQLATNPLLSPPSCRPSTCANKFPQRGPYTHDNRAQGLNPLPLCANCHLYLQQAPSPEAAGGPAMKTQLWQELGAEGRRGWRGHIQRSWLSPSASQIAR